MRCSPVRWHACEVQAYGMHAYPFAGHAVLLGTQLTANCEAKLAKKAQYSNLPIRIAVYYM